MAVSRIRFNNPEKSNRKDEPFVCVYIDTEVDKFVLALNNRITEEVGEVIATADQLREDFDTEVGRSKDKDAELQKAIEDEALEARAAEAALGEIIDEETTRAMNAEDAIDKRINEEIKRSTIKDNALQDALDTETTRSTTRDNALEQSIRGETERAGRAEDTLHTQITDEAKRAGDAEKALGALVTDERTRALAAEHDLNGLVIAETDRARKAETGIYNALGTEISRAEGAEGALTLALDKERIRASAAEGELTINHLAEVRRSIEVDAQHDARLATLENLGHWVGSFDTFAELSSAVLPKGTGVNDYVTVRNDETHLDDHNVPKTTRYILTSLDPITWQFDIVIDADISGKLDKPIFEAGMIAIYDGIGGLLQGIPMATIATKAELAAESENRVQDVNSVRNALAEHLADSVKHITLAERETWNAKLDAAVYEAHANSTVHITQTERLAWNKNIDDITTLNEEVTALWVSVNTLLNMGGHYRGIQVTLPSVNAAYKVGDWLILTPNENRREDAIYHVTDADELGNLVWVKDYDLMNPEYTEYLFQLWIQEHASQGHNINYETAPIETVNVPRGDTLGNVYIEVCGNMVQLYFDRFNPNRRNVQANRWYDTGLRIPQAYRRNSTLEQVTYARLCNQVAPWPLYDVSICIHHDTGVIEMAHESTDGLYNENTQIGGSTFWFIGERV